MSSFQFIGRFEIPVDSKVHGYKMAGPVLHVNCLAPDVIEFWALIDPTGAQNSAHRFAVVGTGNPLPGDGYRYVGTGIAPVDGNSRAVWHLLEVT